MNIIITYLQINFYTNIPSISKSPNHDPNVKTLLEFFLKFRQCVQNDEKLQCMADA